MVPSPCPRLNVPVRDATSARSARDVQGSSWAIASGVPEDTIESINRTRVVLKGPLGTPVGYGEKTANVTLRKLFETYANIRPVRELPGVTTRYSGSGIDLVVVRENVEDLYAGSSTCKLPASPSA